MGAKRFLISTLLTGFPFRFFPFLAFSFNLKLHENALDSTWLDVAFDGIVNYSNGGQGTASHAGYPFDAVLTVRGGFPVLYPQLTYKILQNDVPERYPGKL